MIPVPSTSEQVAWWIERDGGGDLRQAVIGGPEEGPDVLPCPSLVGTVFVHDKDGTLSTYPVHHVAYQLDEIEVAALAQGGTLWLTTWGGLPVHLVEVVATKYGRGDR